MRDTARNSEGSNTRGANQTIGEFAVSGRLAKGQPGLPIYDDKLHRLPEPMFDVCPIRANQTISTSQLSSRKASDIVM